MFGLNCLLKDHRHIQLIGDAMRSMSDTILENKSDAKITIKDLYNRLKKVGVDIDLESTAYIYSDTFANEINKYSNFHTEEELQMFGQIGRDLKKVEAAKNRANKNIVAIEKKIADNDLAIKNRNGVSDIELDKLRETQESLRKELEQKRKDAGIGKYSDASKVSAAEKAAQENIDELERKIAENDLDFIKNDNPTSAQLNDFRERQKDLRKELEQKRKDAGIGKYAAKKALIDAGYGKTLKDGSIILDWVKLMRKSEQDIKDEIKAQNLPNEDEIFEALQDDWVEIIKTALTKAQNNLSKKETPIEPYQKSAIEKISNLYAHNLFGTFKDDYKNAVRKSVGVNSANLAAMAQLDQLGKLSNQLANSPFGTNNILGKVLQHRINIAINTARYADANGIYKFASAFGQLIDMVKLKVLANPINRAENYLSGKAGLLNTAANYGLPEAEIKELAFQYKRDLIRNGGDIEFGDVSNIFTGNNSSANKVRQWINNVMSEKGDNQFINWTYAQLMGTASLNGVDTYNKVINTWGRFIANMEDILISKGQSKQDAQKNLHTAIFGDVALPDGTKISNWELARNKARKAIADFNAKAGSEVFKDNEQNVHIFANDIVKMELLNSSLVTSDELNAAWDAGYKSAGREMGHVANNALSEMLNNFRQGTATKIDELVKNGNYTKAAFLILLDTGVNKIINAFLSGGTNWVILKLEKQGLGIASAAGSRWLDNNSFIKRKRISELNPKEIEEHLYNVQKTKDKFTRGVSGLITNGLITILGAVALSSGGDDEEKRRMRKFQQYMKDHYMVNKVFNKIAPLMIAGYIAKIEQDKEGWENISSAIYGKREPITEFAFNAFNKNPNYEGSTQILKSTKAFSDNPQKQMQGFRQIGKTVGSYLDINPLPTKFIFDIKDISKEGARIFNEISGNKVSNTPYTPEQYQSHFEAFYKEYLKQSILLPK